MDKISSDVSSFSIGSNIFMFSAFVAFIYAILKFMEMRFIDRENRPMKFIIRDSLVVYISILFSYFLMNQLQFMEPNSMNTNLLEPVLTRDPNF